MIFLQTAFSKSLLCLLALAIAVQPVFATPCPCNAPRAEKVARVQGPRCCCCRSGKTCCCRCCCGARGKVAPTACACGAGTTEPQSLPRQGSQRQGNQRQGSPTVELTLALLPTVAMVAETPSRMPAAELPTAFASASEHCIALGRLLI